MSIVITLKKSEIDYDVAMATHVVMNRELASGVTAEQGFNYANTQNETGEANLITRYVEKAISDLAGVMSAYLEDYVLESTNDLKAFEAAVFNLDMPDNFDKTLTSPLRIAMHDYVVNRVIFDWFVKAKPDEAVIYKGLYDEAYSRVKSLLNRRTGISRIKPWPAI